jgi:putative oligomerization/nucleic acid binding protein
MPGLLRGMARTAVVAGTATAVSNRVSRRQAEKWSDQGQEYMPSRVYPAEGYPPQQGYPQEAYPQQAPPPVQDDRERQIAQLKELAELKEQGILTEEEFAAQKAQILGT